MFSVLLLAWHTCSMVDLLGHQLFRICTDEFCLSTVAFDFTRHWFSGTVLIHCDFYITAWYSFASILSISISASFWFHTCWCLCILLLYMHCACLLHSLTCCRRRFELHTSCCSLVQCLVMLVSYAYLCILTICLCCIHLFALTWFSFIFFVRDGGLDLLLCSCTALAYCHTCSLVHVSLYVAHWSVAALNIESLWSALVAGLDLCLVHSHVFIPVVYVSDTFWSWFMLLCTLML